MTVTTFYLFHGDDDLRIEEEVGKLTARMRETPNAELNTAEFDGQTASMSSIVSAVMAYPFMADRRLVIVKGMLSHASRKGAGEAGRKIIEQWAELLPALPEWTRLVFIERTALSDNHRIVKLTRELKSGFEKLYILPKDATSRIVEMAKGYGVSIEPRAAQALAAVTGNDLRRADNELFKLVAYTQGERPISEDDVALLTPYVAEARIFDFVDALAEGRGDKASALAHQIAHDEDDQVFGMFAMIIRQFRLLLLAKEHLAFGGSPRDLAAAIGAAPFVADKVARQSRDFDVRTLERIYRAIQTYDVQMKTGEIKPLLALDLLVATLTRQ